MIVFDEEAHSYTNTETGELYTSATTVLGEFKKKFDADFFANIRAKRDGVTKQEVLDMWAAGAKAATDKGTFFHKLMEKYTITGEKEPEFEKFYITFDHIMQTGLPEYKEIHSEKLLWYHPAKLAGTADMIVDIGSEYFAVLDYKTNKRFNFHSTYNEFFKEPLSHLQICEFTTYALQLSLYAFMYSRMTGRKCIKTIILYVQNGKFLPINVNNLFSDIEKIIDYRINQLTSISNDIIS